MKKVTKEYNNLPKNVRTFFDKQYQDAILSFLEARHPDTGLYADKLLTMGDNPDKLASIAATGVGLIALCMGDMEGFINDAENKIMMTLNTVMEKVAHDPKSNFLAHFVKIDTGENIHSEYSTIDTSILIAGALIAGHYFKDKKPEILETANKLLHKMDWSIVVNDCEKGIINMVSKDGIGIAPLKPFNEYAIVAYLAYLAKPEDLSIKTLWEKHYAVDKINDLPKSYFRRIPVLTDNAEKNGFLSSFVQQFPYYLIPDYHKSRIYTEYLKNACLADRLKWKEEDVPSFVWGFGAGPNHDLYNEYHADKINNSPRNIASSYIVAGFLPVYKEGIYDLFALYQHIPYDTYQNPQDKLDEENLRMAYRYGLHRYSWAHFYENRWYPKAITLIDWSSMIYGLHAYKRGMDLFSYDMQKRL